MSIPSFIITAVILFLATWIFWENKKNRRARRSRIDRLHQRPIEDINSWYNKYYVKFGIQKSTAEMICGSMARCLGCHTTQIFPEDRFDKELHMEGAAISGIDDDHEMEEFWESELVTILGKIKYAELQLNGKNIHCVSDLLLFCDSSI